MAYDDPDKKIYHLCIVNLVIGLVSFYFMSCVNNRVILGPDVQSTFNIWESRISLNFDFSFSVRVFVDMFYLSL